MFHEVIEGIGKFLKGAFDQIPNWILYAVLFGAALSFLLSKDLWKNGLEEMKKFTSKMKIHIKNLINMLKEFFEIFNSYGKTTANFAEFLLNEYELMIEQIEKLETERAK